MRLRLVPKLILLPDPKVPMYRPQIHTYFSILAWLRPKEFYFHRVGDAVYCNPEVLDILDKRLRG